MQNSNAYTLRKQWNDSCLSLGIPALTTDTCARIMAVLMVHGNNEAFTLSGHFNADREYIQQRYHLHGGEIPDPTFATLLRQYVNELNVFEDNFRKRGDTYKGYGDPKPTWARKLFHDMYGFEV